MDELIHGRLALGELDLSVLVPEVVATHHGVDVAHLLLLTLEELWREGVEGVVGEARVTDDGKLLQEAGHDELSEHIVDGEGPRAVGQLCELLYNLHVLDKVDVALLGDGELAALDLIAAVGEDVDVAPEAEVLLVVGQEIEVEALVTIYIDGVLDVEAIEGDGVLADGRREGVLQEAYLVVVDVDIGKNLLHEGVEDVAGLYEVADACRVLSLDDGLLVVRLLAIDVLCDGLIDGDGQDELVVPGAGLNLVDEPLALLGLGTLELVERHLVGSEGELLVLIILVVVAL